MHIQAFQSKGDQKLIRPLYEDIFSSLVSLSLQIDLNNLIKCFSSIQKYYFEQSETQ